MVCQEDTGVKGIPFELGCFLILVSLLKNYIVLTPCTSHVLYLSWEEFEQRLQFTLLSSLLNYNFLSPNFPERLREPYHMTRGKEVVPIRDHNLNPPWVDSELTQRSETWICKYPCCVGRCCGHICLRPTQYKSFDR